MRDDQIRGRRRGHPFAPNPKCVSCAVIAENTLPNTFQRSVMFSDGRSAIVMMQGVYQLCLIG